MLTQTLKVKHTVTRHAQPLLCIDNLPGEGAELTPIEARRLAAALIEAAATGEALRGRCERVGSFRREYAIGA